MENLNKVLINLQCEMVAERNKVNPENISWLQFDILNALKGREEMLPSELNIRLGIPRSKLSKSLKELKVWNYIEQQPSSQDGRELRTFLTETGEQLLEAIGRGHDNLFRVAQKTLSEKEQKAFSLLAKRLLEGLRRERCQCDE